MSGANASGYLESRTMKTETPTVKMVAIAADEAGQRIDNFLRTQLKGVPKSMIYRILRKGEVRVNKKRVKPEYKLEAGDEVRIPPVRVAEREEEAVSPHLQKVAALSDVILYEDDHILVLNKPSGTAVHGGSGLSFGVIEGLRALRPEATRLFVGAPGPACSPYEGVWAAEADGVQPLLFVNPRSMEVERFMRSCGLGRPEGTNEPLDHVATECELLEHLALRAAGAPASEGAPDGADLPGGSPAAAYGRFLSGHAQAWMPAFAERLAAEARHPFYRAAAAYLGALVG